MRKPLVLLVAMFLLVTCAAPPEPETGPPGLTRPAGCGPEGKGMRNADTPVVCVDDLASVLTVDPDPVRLHDVKRDKSGPGTLQWFTRSGKGDLQIRFADESCVKRVNCNGGHCTAVAAKKMSRALEEQRCKYDVLLTGHPTLDPETVLTGCCVLNDGEP